MGNQENKAYEYACPEEETDYLKIVCPTTCWVSFMTRPKDDVVYFESTVTGCIVDDEYSFTGTVLFPVRDGLHAFVRADMMRGTTMSVSTEGDVLVENYYDPKEEITIFIPDLVWDYWGVDHSILTWRFGIVAR